MKMSPEMFEQYSKNPLGMDETVRAHFKLPPNKYYSVSVWPEAGVIRLNYGMNRNVPAPKISKSDQK